MADRYAIRDVEKCTKDCLCLYVCPTGAADTENSIIDIEKCIGCGACAQACPSRAISMIPKILPAQQKHNDMVVDSMNNIFESKIKQELFCKGSNKKIVKAIGLSNRTMAEDIKRESGYMLPQSRNSLDFLENLKLLDLPDEINDKIYKLLDLIKCNE